MPERKRRRLSYGRILLRSFRAVHCQRRADNAHDGVPANEFRVGDQFIDNVRVEHQLEYGGTALSFCAGQALAGEAPDRR